MIAPASNHWKLGLFVVLGLVLGLVCVVLLGAHSQQKEVSPYITYFDESVQGLDVGSEIKFRGVPIGAVGRIGVAQDHRRVEVQLDITLEELARLGLDVPKDNVPRDDGPKLEQADDLRVQLASAGLTGLKFLQLDFFPVAEMPPPQLRFATPDNYIPAAPSTMKNLEDAAIRTMNRLPELGEQMAGILVSVDAVALELKNKHIAERLAVSLDGMDRVLVRTSGSLERLDTVSTKAGKLLDGLDQTVTRTNGLLAQVGSERGLLASVGRATDAVGDTARDASGLGVELDETLRAVREAAKSFRRLTDALEKDPDILLKGYGDRSAR
jgi:phospholipid/cholesterol/gamma-HCH transport system substrate-binding protein